MPAVRCLKVSLAGSYFFMRLRWETGSKSLIRAINVVNFSDDITLLKLIVTNVMVFLLQISGVDGDGSGYDTDRNRNRLLKEEGR